MKAPQKFGKVMKKTGSQKIISQVITKEMLKVQKKIGQGSSRREAPIDKPGDSTSSRGAPYETPGACLFESSPNGRECPQEFLLEESFDAGIDEKELIKAATTRSLVVQSQSKEETDSETLVQKYKEEQTKAETCTVIVLRKKIMQTCVMAIQKETFDFAKLPCIVFSREDAADLGGPCREFYKLLMRGVCLELGVFEMSRNNLVFSHDYSVISSWKPYLAGQLLSRSILHGGPGLHSLSKDVYHVMTNMNDDVDAGRAALSIAEDGAAEVARALMAVDGDSDEELEEFKNQKMKWLLKVHLTPQIFFR